MKPTWLDGRWRIVAHETAVPDATAIQRLDKTGEL
jgi:hypothetical protein